MVMSVTDVLNVWNDMGVFSYVIPFLLIFAVVFAILKKTKILGNENDGILAIISVAVGLLSLQFDVVSEFYAVIFPRFGVGLSIFLVLIIFIGFFFPKDSDIGKMKPIGYVVGIGAVAWALVSWGDWVGNGIGWWVEEYFWSIIILALVVGVIGYAVKSGGNGGGTSSTD